MPDDEKKPVRRIVTAPKLTELVMPADERCARIGHNNAVPVGYTRAGDSYSVWYRCSRCGQERSEQATEEQVREYFGSKEFGKHANSEKMKTHY
jgi:DNA-directed RNA polymerase subunit RPC12/RpoP